MDMIQLKRKVARKVLDKKGEIGYNEEPETRNQKRNIVSIQLLRAIAALSVVYTHSTAAGDYNFPPAGAFGFDIFFIISGFIIAYMVSGNTENFLVKRIIRIAPLYVLATIVMTMTVAFFPNLIGSTTISFSGFIKSVLFIPGPENRGYPILGQGWTLNFEMFFYFVMFLCILTPRFLFPENGGDVLHINNIARYFKSKGYTLVLWLLLKR